MIIYVYMIPYMIQFALGKNPNPSTLSCQNNLIHHITERVDKDPMLLLH